MKPREVFVEITVRSYEGSKKDLKTYVDAAWHAVQQRANDENVFCGLIGRRAVISIPSFTRHMRRHGFYGKSK